MRAPLSPSNKVQIPQHGMQDGSWSRPGLLYLLTLETLYPAYWTTCRPKHLQCPLKKRSFAHAVLSAWNTLFSSLTNLPLPGQVLLLLRSWLGCRLPWEAFFDSWASGNGPSWVLEWGTWVSVVFLSPGPAQRGSSGNYREWASRGAAVSGEVRVGSTATKRFSFQE